MISTSKTSYVVTDYDTTVGENTAYVMRVRDMSEDQKPREKMSANGSTGLSNAELLAVVFGQGNKKEELMGMCSRILSDYGPAALSNETDPRRVSEILDIPIVKASQLVACFELGRRFYMNNGAVPSVVRTPEQANEYFKSMANLKKEQLRGIYLNSRFAVVYDEVISTGSLTANIVHPREVFAPALEHGAVGVILAHNHPSGELSPTSEDIETTNKLRVAAATLGLDLIDHLIISGNGFNSIISTR